MSDVIGKVIGERIRIFRKRKGITQEELAHRASFSTSYISDVERAEKSPTIESLIRITDALGITLEELFANAQSKRKTKEADTVDSIINKVNNLPLSELQTVNNILDLLLNFREK
ncbi:helix-turn-helix domain-containing protein [Paenibacillus sp. YIM B09110]|uniref:helix-turn-helix domain-containing protein n=1 Tax=Paenibacillus sp. YIM B09110 TaxID=3126102 RepID=UPI00301D966F